MNERKVGKIVKYKVFKEVIVIPVVVGALGAISTGFVKYIAAIGIEMRVEHAQKKKHKKTALLETARILKLVLGC